MSKKILTCLGVGDFNFDIVMQRSYPKGCEHNNTFVEDIVWQELGGNCGNVMCELAYFGWRAFPFLKTNVSRVGQYILKDLERFGVEQRFVEVDKMNPVAIFKTTHGLDKNGVPVMSFQKLNMGGHYERFAPAVKQMDYQNKEYVRFLESLDFVPDVFFMGSDAAAYRKVAEALHAQGSLVYFEKNSKLEFPKDLKFAKVSDVIKFSRETLPDVSPLMELGGNKLIVQTLDAEGVRFKLGANDWVNVPPVPNADFKDPQGAGDWFTSSFIHALGELDLLAVEKMTVEKVQEAVLMAERVASKSVSYIGAKGMIYAERPLKVQSNGLEKVNFLGLNEKIVKKPVEGLEDIPEKDYREYDIAHAHAYRSDFDCVNGVERHLKKRACNPLSNFYLCEMHFDGKEFYSAEQLYHYLKFTGNEGLQTDILACYKPLDVMKLCSGKAGYADHDRTRWMHMTLAMEVKYLCCKEFRDMVRQSGDLPLVEVQEKFDVHGATVRGDHAQIGGSYQGHDVSDKYVGMNGCGRCMMAVREKFKDIDVEHYDARFTTLDEWWAASPVYQQLLDGMGKK